MKATLVSIFTVSCALLSFSADPAVLEGPLRTIAQSNSRELLFQEVAKAESTMTPQTIVDETVSFLLSSNNAAEEGAAMQFILAMKRFPFDELCDRFTKSKTSTERAYTLHLLGHSAPNQTHDDTLKKLASTLLYDKGSGLRRYGEARAYSREGKRVCDVAYNILVSKMGLEAAHPLLDVDNFMANQRDQMIEKLGVDLKLPKPPSWNAPTQKPSEEAPSNFSPPKSPAYPKETDEKPVPTAGDEPPSSTPWSIIAALIVAAGGLLWLLLKRRS
ncbi:MAG: hypothetical protein R3F31_04640 [Verrucomicrobiales bacterium]